MKRRGFIGAGLALTSSLADTVMIHLAEQVAPGIDVLFLDTGYHFVETIGTRDAVAAVQIMGKKSKAVETVLGYKGRTEMIHRDDLVLGAE